MSSNAPLRILLGPQRPKINLDAALAYEGVNEGPIGVISAAWQEAEGDFGELQQLARQPMIDLGLYRQAENVFSADAQLHAAYRDRQQRLQEQQELYRLRLRQLMIAARSILRAPGDKKVLAEERRHAIAQLRALDRHHLLQVRKLQARFDAVYSVAKHEQLASVAEAMTKQISECETVLITGGNVLVLINRLRLFNLEHVLRDKAIIAWSAGAMALCERIVLYHDRLPQGRRDAEVLCDGLGIIPNVVLLPQGSIRLRLNEKRRMSLFCRRFSQSSCILLDNGAQLLMQGTTLSRAQAVDRLTQDGGLAPLDIS